MKESQEIWRLVPSEPHIMVSNLGRVMQSPYTSENNKSCGGKPTYGYWESHRYVYRTKDRKYKVHRLVCEAFHGQPKEGQVCLHLDEDATNNKPSNLKWGTQKENMNFPKYKENLSKRMRKFHSLKKIEQHA